MLPCAAALCTASPAIVEGRRRRCLLLRHRWPHSLEAEWPRCVEVAGRDPALATLSSEPLLPCLELAALLPRLPPPLDSLLGARPGGPVDALPALDPRLLVLLRPRTALGEVRPGGASSAEADAG